MNIFTIGKHKVKCGSITNGIDDLMGNQVVDIIYTDPPWGDAHIKFFYSMNEKDTGQKKENISFDSFLNIMFSIFRKYTNKFLFLEYGIKWREMIINYGKSFGFNHNIVIPLLYKSDGKILPLDLHIFSKPGVDVSFITNEYINSVSNRVDYEALIYVFKPFIGKDLKVLDPMCGLGNTAQICIDYDFTFLGNELNSKRLIKTIDRLSKNKKTKLAKIILSQYGKN